MTIKEFAHRIIYGFGFGFGMATAFQLLGHQSGQQTTPKSSKKPTPGQETPLVARTWHTGSGFGYH
jgi:hypothetical protein